MTTVYTHLQQQEELAALFHRNLTLDPVSRPMPAPEPAPAPVEEPEKEHKIVYISQHYTHSAHIAKPDTQQQYQQPPRPASEPPQSEYAAVEQVLREHSVDTSGLSAAQLELFKTVDTPEKLRLMELWRACPPRNSTDNPTLTWSMTSVEQEETLARLRFEQQQQDLIDQQLQQEFGMMQDEPEPEPETVMSLDGTPLTPIQAGDGHWISIASPSNMEPYMASGYEEMARREYEDSVRRAYAEAAAMPPFNKQMTISSTTAMPTFSLDTAAVPRQGPAAAAGSAVLSAGCFTRTFNSSHADPVYKTTNVGAGMDWGRQAAMEDQYGRAMAMREDEEML
ncbi:hypothetical protein B0J18DRAFT_370041 [Chaetomium sp. MPI-SDFR-AT-0129]|nr:hypothetical protein B0J18DRAFT_370041 [Chaetomium sp. MPI-SDFR-AT-0129]